jgi:enoyl-CoA hydratase
MTVTYRIEGALGVITLANPPYNTLVDPLFADARELSAFLATPVLKAALIQGSGRHFCGGADLAALTKQLGDPAALAARLDQGKALLDIIESATIPTAALVRGSCLGAGFEIALACHFRFAARNAMLGFPESEAGLMPGFGASLRAGGLVNRGALVKLILSGEMVRGEDAAAMGLVDAALPADELEKAATGFLTALTARRSTQLIRAVMTAIHNSRRLPRREALLEETRLFCELGRASLDGEAR